MMLRLISAIFIGLFLNGHCFAQTIDAPVIHEGPQKATQEHLIRGDIISVEIENVPELSGQYNVDNQGNIDMPHIGKVIAIGKNTTTLAEILEELYIDDYLVNPAISVSIFAKVLPAKEIVSQTMPYAAPLPIIDEVDVVIPEPTAPITNSESLPIADIDIP